MFKKTNREKHSLLQNVWYWNLLTAYSQCAVGSFTDEFCSPSSEAVSDPKIFVTYYFNQNDLNTWSKQFAASNSEV